METIHKKNQQANDKRQQQAPRRAMHFDRQRALHLHQNYFKKNRADNGQEDTTIGRNNNNHPPQPKRHFDQPATSITPSKSTTKPQSNNKSSTKPKPSYCKAKHLGCQVAKATRK
jgi:hypothetical protein